MPKPDVPIELDRKFVEDPRAFYESLRHAPVQQVIMPPEAGAWLPPGRRVWLATSYSDARALLADSRLRKDNDRMMELYRARQAADTPERGFSSALEAHLLNLDPPDHTRLRKLVTQAFTRRTVERLRPRLEQVAAELLDDVEGAGTVDLLDAFASPLPIIAICELLGVPHADRARFRTWSGTIVRSADPAQLQDHSTALAAYLAELIEAKRAAPGEDLLSGLVHVTDAGDRLSEVELLSMAFLLLVAGHETTVNLIGNGVLILLRRPELLARLRQDPALIPGAIEEFLRFESPVHLATLRFTAEPVRVGEVEIPAGEFVLVSLLAANRDAARFPDPHECDITRPAGGHLAFGHGIHHCLGAPLARMEGEIALRALLGRFGNLELDAAPDSVRWQESVLTRGLDTLKVRVS
ncbi:cytochrome P450 [Amycolatopsis sp. NEAU-NG30]|uniref:Cytochrome P450 n=1 Tax=Amycolatopsis melonis TaxID=3156488 RepID=A0ABV0LRE5_9PSEU